MSTTWHKIAPFGKFPHSGVVQSIDAKALRLMTQSFQTHCVVDYDHFSQDLSKPSEAAGWVEAVANRDDGLYAQIRWSDSGEQAIAGGRYAYLSPVFDCVPTTGDEVRPFRLVSVALTNTPGIPGLTLSNRGGDAELDYRLELCTELGIPSDSTDDAIRVALERYWSGQRPPSLAEKLAWSREKARAREAVKNEARNQRFQSAMAAMVNRIATDKSARALRELARNYPADSYLRQRLEDLANERR